MMIYVLLGVLAVWIIVILSAPLIIRFLDWWYSRFGL
jgi:hypothetical protein